MVSGSSPWWLLRTIKMLWEWNAFRLFQQHLLDRASQMMRVGIA